jgi:Domain of unknown function (DUF4190)
MSDSSQGPGWWLASDGRWYPPQTPPTPAPAPASASAPMPPPYVPVTGGPVPSRATNGLAVAALVLGILWLCAVGSILAIVFGLVALGQIKRSAQDGKGLAIAGLVLGIVGVLATVAIAFAVRRAANEIVDNQPDEFDDVSVVSCTRNLDGFGVAELEITNDSSKSSTYLIAVEFRDSSGARFGTGTFDALSDVDPGETATVRAVSTDRIEGELVRCRPTFVERVAND